jgi:transglutaminase-like putative cysteine protease
VPRTLAVVLLASPLLAWSWLRLEDQPGNARAALMVVLAMLPALVPGTWRRLGATVLACLIAGATAWDLEPGLGLPGTMLSRFGGGFAEFYDVQVPFDGAAHPRMHGVVLMALFVFTLAVALAAAASRPGLAGFALVVGAGWPSTLLPGHDLLLGALLLGAVLAIVTILRRGPLRGLGHALVAGAVVVLAAVAASSSPAFAKQAFLEWQRWDPYTKPAKPVDVSYVWDSSYSGLTFRGKPTTVLRIKADKTPQYWRATVLNTVEQGRWFEEPALQDFEPDVLGEPGLVPSEAETRAGWTRQEVKVEALRDPRLVARSTPVFFEPGSDVGRVYYDATGIAVAAQPLHRGDTYLSWSYSPAPTPAQLARSKPVYPRLIRRDKYREIEPRVYPKLFGTPGREAYVQYLLTDYYGAWRLRAYRPLYSLARQVAGGAKSPYAAAVALERWFRIGGGFTYDQHPGQAAGVPPLVDFVTRTRRGYCQHFAGAMALMLRYLGIPSRVAAGFTSGRYDKDSETWTVSDRDAHTWVEVWFRGWGWLPFDPTPGRSGIAGPYSSSSPTFDVLAATAVLAGKRGFSKGFVTSLANRLGFGGPARVSPDVPDLRAAPVLAEPEHSRAWGLLRLLATALAGLTVLIGLAKLVVRRSRFLTRDPRRLAGACRRDLRDFLLDQGLEVPRSATLRELAALVEEEFGVRAGGFGLHATAARFGPHAGGREAARAMRRDLRLLRKGLRRELTWLERTRGVVSLRSLGLAG